MLSNVTKTADVLRGDVENRFEQLRNCVSPGDSGPSPSNLRSRYGRTEMHIEWHSKDCTDVLMYTILVGEEYW